MHVFAFVCVLHHSFYSSYIIQLYRRFKCFWQALVNSLADSELDDAKDLAAEELPELTPVIRERGSVQLSSIPEPVTVRGWPMGLALASAPSITVSLTATGFQKMVSMMASLNLPSRRGEYKVEPNQCTEELASIRAQPKVWIQIQTHCSAQIMNMCYKILLHFFLFA